MRTGSLSPEQLLAFADPVLFNKIVLEREAYPAQQIPRRCPHPNVLDCPGRGTGKSTVFVGDDNCHRSSVIPYVAGLVNKLDAPVPFRAVLFSKTKEQAYDLQTAIRSSFDRNAWLRSLIDPSSTKTNLKLADSRGVFAEIVLRPATDAARGKHAVTRTMKGDVIKGIIRLFLDEGWFLKDPKFVDEVLMPMLGVGGPGSGIVIASTPKGVLGPVANMYNSPFTGRCSQLYVRDENKRRVYAFVDDGKREVFDGFGPVAKEDARRKQDKAVSFDPKLCIPCMMKYRCVVHNFPSWENPYQNLKELLKKKRELLATGKKLVWDQEYEGIPVAISGLFFNERHHEMMWDPALPLYRLNEFGDLVLLREVGDEGVEEEFLDPRVVFGGRDTRFYQGYDPNQGVVSSRVDYGAMAVVMVRNGKAQLVFCARYQKPPRYFRGKEYSPSQLIEFMDDLWFYLWSVFKPEHGWVDQGGGQSCWSKHTRLLGEGTIDYVKTSRQAKLDGFMNLRGLIEAGLFTMPMIEWLETECEYLEVDNDALEIDDQIKIHKAASWGTQGAQVDGLNAVANACLGVRSPGVIVMAGSTQGELSIVPSAVPQIGDGRVTKLQTSSYAQRLGRG